MTVELEVFEKPDEGDELKPDEKVYSWRCSQHPNVILAVRGKGHSEGRMEAIEKLKNFLNELLEEKYKLYEW